MEQLSFRRLYGALVFVRLLCALLARSYIHPDEYFQSVEPLSASILGTHAFIPWEFTPLEPLRSIIPAYIVAGVPLHAVRVLVALAPSLTASPWLPEVLFVAVRLWMFALSFVLDASLWQLCGFFSNERSIGHAGARSRLLVLAASMPMLAFCTRTFSNTFETLALALATALLFSINQRHWARGNFLYGFVCCLGFFGRFSFAFFVAPHVIFWCWHNLNVCDDEMVVQVNVYSHEPQQQRGRWRRPGRAVHRRLEASFTNVLSRSAKVGLLSCFYAALAGVLCAALLCITVDTLYYGCQTHASNCIGDAAFAETHVRWTDLWSMWRGAGMSVLSRIAAFIPSDVSAAVADTYSVVAAYVPLPRVLAAVLGWLPLPYPWWSADSVAVTPLNFYRYNVDASNLLDHGQHPHYTHALVNFPQLFGPIVLCWLLRWALQRRAPQRRRRRGRRGGIAKYIAKGHDVAYKSLRLALISPVLTGVGMLSIPIHQEARFLLPCLFPLCVLLGDFASFAGCADAGGGGGKRARRRAFWRRHIWTLYLVLNLLLVIVFGILHQGGTVPLLLSQGGTDMRSVSSAYADANGGNSAGALTCVAWSADDDGGGDGDGGTSSVSVTLSSHYVFFHTYMPPRSLFARASTVQCGGSGAAAVRQHFRFYDLIGGDTQVLFDTLASLTSPTLASLSGGGDSGGGGGGSGSGGGGGGGGGGGSGGSGEASAVKLVTPRSVMEQMVRPQLDKYNARAAAATAGAAASAMLRVVGEACEPYHLSFEDPPHSLGELGLCAYTFA